MRHFLGIDCGGTKCEAVLIREDGHAVGWGRCDASEPESHGSGRNPYALQVALRRAVGPRPPPKLAVWSTWPQRGFPPEWNRKYLLRKIDEPSPALILTPDRTGVVALAGTGARVYGRDETGRWLNLDGLGPNLGDFGSAYSIGLRAVRAAAMTDWHPRHHTSLAPKITEAACRLFPGPRKSFSLIGFILVNPDRFRVAALARIVSEEAEAGDPIAREILRKAAESQAELVYDLADRMGFLARPVPLIGMGGVIRCSSIYWGHLCRRVHSFAPQMKPSRLVLPPAGCMALLGLSSFPRTDLPAATQRLCATLPEVCPDLRGRLPADGLDHRSA